MLKAVRAYLRRNAIRGPGEVVVACSGGPDSTALAYVLADCGPALGLGTVLAHLDHGLRDAAEREEERQAVRELSRTLGLPLVAEAVAPGHIAERARTRGESPEEASRAERYAFLDRVRRERGCRWVALGHTADDFAETMVMRILQGVGVSGLGGIPEYRDLWIRPLIRVTRAQVIEYLHQRGVHWVEDSTNRDPRYLRNAVRARLIPAIAEVFPGYRESLQELSRKAAAVASHLREVAAASLPWVKRDRGLYTSWSAFCQAPGVVRTAAVFQALDALGGRRVPHRYLDCLERQDLEARSRVLLSGRGFRVERRGERLWVLPDIVRAARIGYLVHVGRPGRYVVPRCAIVVNVASGPDAYRKAGSPVVVRSGRPGDCMRLGGRAESLERIADRCRVPSDARSVMPIVADQSGLCRVLGSAVGGLDVAARSETCGEAPGAGITVRVSREES